MTSFAWPRLSKFDHEGRMRRRAQLHAAWRAMETLRVSLRCPICWQDPESPRWIGASRTASGGWIRLKGSCGHATAEGLEWPTIRAALEAAAERWRKHKANGG